LSVRISTTAAVLLAGVLWAPLALAAAAPVVPPLRLASNLNSLPERGAVALNLNLGGIMGPALAQASASLRPNVVSLGRGVQLELGHGRNWDATGDLFAGIGALNSSYLSGTNSFASGTVALGRDVTFSAGHVDLGIAALSDTQPSAFAQDLAARLGANFRSAGSSSASLNWNFSDWAGLGITASHSQGNASLLGGVPAALRGANAAATTALGISARAEFAEGWVTTLSYAEGVSQLDLSGSKIITSNDNVRSDSFGIGLAKTGLFGDDAFGIALSRPLQIYTGANNFGALNTNFALANTQARESDVALGYVTTFLDGTLALQANAAYQLNAAGARGQTAVAGVARAKLNF
jgi:hypothetical protein